MKAVAALLGSGLALASALALLGWIQVHQLKEQVLEKERALQDMDDRIGDVGRELEKEQERSADLEADASEVHRLRGEVARLAGTAAEIERIKAERSRLAQQIQELGRRRDAGRSRPPPVPGMEGGEARQNPGLFLKDDWFFRGYETPEDALVSSIWSMMEGDPESYLASLAPEEQDRMLNRWEGKTAQEIADKHRSDVEQITGIQVLDSQQLSDRAILMDVYVKGAATQMRKVVMRQIDGQWLYAGEAAE